ncbi:hypothetical protein BU26DRAFT_558619 [Trematosphaeria pertusa]|uniref:Uncharacterized protein n=1 Tax=Trematosphaeria pertusa TaxID=390896 RepID=A0A6A6J5Q4_9PLEO|nr:uncharacterized protein BU26DRAFT_558619 [Trematosphaeria pertusa]KAF2257220.1 hypothetical protein BU26DRAFT_558619 [Trematosphaeria pertusa]
MTGAITAVTVMGTMYGAGLKSRQEYKQLSTLVVWFRLPPLLLDGSSIGKSNANALDIQERRRMLEATPEEMISQLEVARSELVSKKIELERKIATISARRQEKEQEQKGAR